MESCLTVCTPRCSCTLSHLWQLKQKKSCFPSCQLVSNFIPSSLCLRKPFYQVQSKGVTIKPCTLPVHNTLVIQCHYDKVPGHSPTSSAPFEFWHLFLNHLCFPIFTSSSLATVDVFQKHIGESACVQRRSFGPRWTPASSVKIYTSQGDRQ